MAIKVGSNINGKVFEYFRCECLENGWIDSSKYLPKDFDLLDLQTENGKIKMGWRSGNIWDGMKIKENEKILFWRKRKEIY